MKAFGLLVLLIAVIGSPLGAAPDPHWHDFDFEFGPAWRADLHLLAKRLAGSRTWIEYKGTLTSHPLWNGKGNISELDVASSTSRIDGGALHLYNPDTRKWSVWFANVVTGTLGVPSVGSFENGRGVLYDRERSGGKMVYVRQIFSNISPHTFDFHQAFSADNGKTWETNLVINYTR